MAKTVNSLNMEEEIWKQLEERAKAVKRSRSELAEMMLAENLGLNHLLPAPEPHRRRDK